MERILLRASARIAIFTVAIKSITLSSNLEFVFCDPLLAPN
jgi:hypothetical protein